MSLRKLSFALFPFVSLLFSQPTVWRVNTIAGTFPLGNEGPATNAILGRPRHLVYDRSGNLYVADTDNNQIRRIGRDGRIVAIAGNTVRGNGGDGGAALQASLDRPRSIAVDGNLLYIADDFNLRVRVVNLETGMIEAYAGSGVSGFAGDGGPAGNARFRSVGYVTLDAQGNLLISDTLDHRVRRVNRQTGIITTVAGIGTRGAAADGSPANTAPLNSPEALAADAAGNLYIANRGNARILRVDPAGNIRRIAGTLTSFTIADNIPALETFMFEPAGLALDAAKRLLYVTDWGLCTVRAINLETGFIDTVVGNGERPCGYGGDGEGGRTAVLGGPWGVALDSTGNLAISDLENYRIRRLSPNGTVDTIAGRVPFAGDGGPATAAIFFQPWTAISDGAGGYLVADSSNCVIRRISAAGLVSTFAGRPGNCGGAANTDGLPAAQATFNYPVGLVRDARGNVYVSEGSRVRRISGEDGRVSSVARNLSGPWGIALDAAEENLYVAESSGNRITRIALAAGTAAVYAGPVGGTGGFAGDGGVASAARFEFPADVAVDRNGNVYVADLFNQRIRRIEANTLRVSTVAGNGTSEATADGPAGGSGLPLPTSVAVAPDGMLYAASGQRIVRITPGSNSQVQAIAGAVTGGLAGDGGLGPNARFNVPTSVRLAGATLLVTDSANHRIRTLTPVRAAAVAILSGNNQSGGAGTLLTAPLVVQVRLADGTPVPGVPVAFTASAGTLDPARPVLTGADGQAAVALLLPATAGAVTVTAAVEGLPPVTFSATATPVVTVVRPRISSVITAGAFGAARRIAPGAWIEIYGTNLARETRQWSGDDFVGGAAPTTLGGVRVVINDRPAFVQLISPGQINALAPDGLATGQISVQVINSDGPGEPFLVEAAPRAPALLAPAAFAAGGVQYAVALLPDGVFAGPENLIPGAAFRPARAGDRLVFYGVGFGATTPAVPAGQVAGQATALPNLRVRFGDREAMVEYGGLAGGFVGLYQLNVVVPEGVAGDAPLAVSVDGVPLAQTLFVAVR